MKNMAFSIVLADVRKIRICNNKPFPKQWETN